MSDNHTDTHPITSTQPLTDVTQYSATTPPAGEILLLHDPDTAHFVFARCTIYSAAFTFWLFIFFTLF